MSNYEIYDRYDRHSHKRQVNGYDDYDEYDEYDAARELRRRKARAKRRAEERKRKKRIFYIKAVARLVICILLIVGAIVGVVLGIKKVVSSIKSNKENSETTAISDEATEDIASDISEPISVVNSEIAEEPEEEPAVFYTAQETPDTLNYFPEGVASAYGILIDVESGNIIRQLEGRTRMFPASMTKVLTALVACENLTESDLDNTFTMTPEITYYAYKNDCSAVGFSDEEVVTVRDLLYGTILPSGGDAAVALATYIAGDQENFVAMMNEKLAEMGLAETTHFTNCVGLFDENHYTTCYDMAMIMEAAVNNPLCREVMHAHIYTTSSTPQHPNGIEVSNWFLRRIEDHVSGGEVYCAKTGFVNESGNCAVSYGITSSGKEYICATGSSTGNWKCIKDHVAIYRTVFDGDGTSNLDAIPEDGDITEGTEN